VVKVMVVILESSMRLRPLNDALVGR